MQFDVKTNPTQIAHEAYDAPRIETVLSPEELEREVTYAGTAVISDPT